MLFKVAWNISLTLSHGFVWRCSVITINKEILFIIIRVEGIEEGAVWQDEAWLKPDCPGLIRVGARSMERSNCWLLTSSTAPYLTVFLLPYLYMMLKISFAFTGVLEILHYHWPTPWPVSFVPGFLPSHYSIGFLAIVLKQGPPQEHPRERKKKRERALHVTYINFTRFWLSSLVFFEHMQASICPVAASITLLAIIL